MSIKITVLKTGEHIISDMKELMTEGEENAQAYMLVHFLHPLSLILSYQK